MGDIAAVINIELAVLSDFLPAAFEITWKWGTITGDGSFESAGLFLHLNIVASI